MKLSDYLGEGKVQLSEAKNFIQHWFDPNDRICVVARRSEKSGALDTLSQSMIASEFCQLTDDDFEALIFDGNNKWNLYFGVAPIKEDVSLFRRGTEDNVSHVPGVWADIDVKPEGFTSQKEILKFLQGLKLTPSIICGSGSGGVHAYWKLPWGEKGNKELVERWWSYLDEAAGEGRSIDKLIDTTRILRIPGSVYFPKEKSGGKVGSVVLIYLSTTTYSVSELRTASEEAYQTKMTKRKSVINNDAQNRLDMDSLAKGLMANAKGNRWGIYRAISELETYVNTQMTWEEILEPHGWTFMRTLRDESKEWARPGRRERSAVVDFEDSPVMSLLSSSEETGLSDLKDAHIALTKFRVCLRLMFGDDNKLMVSTLVDRIQNDEAFQESLHLP